jgi:hypothetical protein
MKNHVSSQKLLGSVTVLRRPAKRYSFTPPFTAETLDADDVTLLALILGLNDPVDALVDSLVMVVFKVLGEDVPQLLLG